jgi:hypothetical protein
LSKVLVPRIARIHTQYQIQYQNMGKTPFSLHAPEHQRHKTHHLRIISTKGKVTYKTLNDSEPREKRTAKDETKITGQCETLNERREIDETYPCQDVSLSQNRRHKKLPFHRLSCISNTPLRICAARAPETLVSRYCVSINIIGVKHFIFLEITGSWNSIC